MHKMIWQGDNVGVVDNDVHFHAKYNSFLIKKYSETCL